MVEEFSKEQGNYEFILKFRDMEQGQKLMKERILLIGQNLIELQEKNLTEITELKKKIYELETELRKAKNTLSLVSEEISKSARKEEVAILERQFKMFEPLKFARIEDVEKILEKKLGKTQVKEEKETSFWSNKL
jgi:predicted S18 family serine protease